MFNKLRLFMTVRFICFESTNLLAKKGWYGRAPIWIYHSLWQKSSHLSKETILASTDDSIMSKYATFKLCQDKIRQSFKIHCFSKFFVRDSRPKLKDLMLNKNIGWLPSSLPSLNFGNGLSYNFCCSENIISFLFAWYGWRLSS